MKKKIKQKKKENKKKKEKKKKRRRSTSFCQLCIILLKGSKKSQHTLNKELQVQIVLTVHCVALTAGLQALQMAAELALPAESFSLSLTYHQQSVPLGTAWNNTTTSIIA